MMHNHESKKCEIRTPLGQAKRVHILELFKFQVANGSQKFSLGQVLSFFHRFAFHKFRPTYKILVPAKLQRIRRLRPIRSTNHTPTSVKTKLTPAVMAANQMAVC